VAGLISYPKRVDNDFIQIRKLQSGDITGAMNLVLAEGWNQTEKDWDILIRNPQNVCLAAVMEKKIIGTGTAINYGNKVAWIGMVLVGKDFRGRGISKMLLSSLFERLKFCESLKLDATPAGQPVYKKLGFEDEYTITRMICLNVDKLLPATGEIVPQKIQKEDIPAILELDREAFGADRSPLPEAFIANFPEKGVVVKRDGKISGFALGRRGNKYHQIGPVIARSADDALLLVRFALHDLQGRAVVIDILNDKKELAEELVSLGFEPQRPFQRMYRGENRYPGIGKKQFLICGPEFG
jgi:GNAT superfamily N-acetyltransferase